MLFDIKKLFTNGSTLGRFEYLKILTLSAFLMVIIYFLFVVTPPVSNNLLFYSILAITLIALIGCNVISFVAAYKRLSNIFDKTAYTVISFIIFFISGIISILQFVFVLAIMLIPGKKKSDNIVSDKLFWIILPLTVILFAFGKYLAFVRWIPGESMANTLQANDRIVFNGFEKNYERGDIIVFKAPLKKSIDHVKRIVALPGETVDFKTTDDGATYLYINGKKLDEPYVKDVYDYPNPANVKIPYQALTVPQDSYYVLGDNRGNSLDSRFYGAISKDLIKGKVLHIWFPFNRRQVFKTPEYRLPEN